MEDEDEMLPWNVEDFGDDRLTLCEYDRAIPGMQFKLVCRGKEKGSEMPYYPFVHPFLSSALQTVIVGREMICSQELNSTSHTLSVREKYMQLLVCILRA